MHDIVIITTDNKHIMLNFILFLKNKKGGSNFNSLNLNVFFGVQEMI